MMAMRKLLRMLGGAPLLCGCLFAGLACYAQEKKEVMGEVQFIGAGKAEKTSSVWVDGQYVGYLDELKGAKKVMLLPGEHEIVVRQPGYKDFIQKIVVEPGKRTALRVAIERDLRFQYPAVYSEIKLQVTPDRATVFVDDRFAGDVHEFGGVGRKMQVSPGKHRIKIALPGYRTFETEVNLLPNQKFTLKAKLVKASITQADALIENAGPGEARTRTREQLTSDAVLSGQNVFAIAPSTTLVIGGVNTAGVRFMSLKLSQRNDGFIQGTLDGVGLKEAVAGILRGPGMRSAPLRLRLSDAAGGPLFVMVAILAPLDRGAGLTVRGLRVPGALCDLGSLQTNLVALKAQRLALLSQISQLEADIAGAELASDSARVVALKALLDAKKSNLASVDIAIQAVLNCIELCRSAN